MNNRSTGDYFENIAVKNLISKNYEIIERNFFAGRFGEIDIIAKFNNKIVFVEVKGRTNDEFGPGELALTPTKKRHLIKACLIWFAKHHLDNEWQIDVIAMDLVKKENKNVIKLRHYKNCITQNDYR
jgi:putative endonuclease